MTISIGRRKLRDGRISLFLNINMGHGKRFRRNIELILEKPTSPEARKDNRMKMELARRIRAKYELEVASAMYHLPRPIMPKLLLEAYMEYLKGYRRTDRAMVVATGHYLVRYTAGQQLWLHEVTTEFCAGFLEYMIDSGLRGNTPAGYFKKFRAFLGSEIAIPHLRVNPARRVRVSIDEAMSKQTLTSEELGRLFHTSCDNNEVKRAFLFACNTGLRWVDICLLREKNINVIRRELNIIQHKVEGHSRSAALQISLNESAFELAIMPYQQQAALSDWGIDGTPEGERTVFDLPSYTHSLRVIRRWVGAAGINKHITFHCARHTFITNLVRADVHLSTVASLAGHSSTRHTERYVHITDTQRREAVDRLPTVLNKVAYPSIEADVL